MSKGIVGCVILVASLAVLSTAACHARDEEITQEVIREFKVLLQIRGTPRWMPFRGDHAKQYQLVSSLAARNPDAIVEIVCSSNDFTVQEKKELMRIGGHGGSVWKKDNAALFPVMAGLRECKSELPEEIVDYLDWLKKTHGY